MAGDLWAVVPFKDPRQAKRRLAPLLAADERAMLARAMAADVLAALAAAPGLAGIAVVAPEFAARDLAASAGVRVIDDAGAGDMCAAIARAVRQLMRERVAGMLVVPADVPLVTPAEIEAAIALQGNAGPAVTLVPATRDAGTNGLACSPVDAIPPRFGPDSFPRHRAAALARGLRPRTIRLPNWGSDIDLPADLLAFVAQPSPTRSHACLEGLGIAARLRRAAPACAPALARSAG